MFRAFSSYLIFLGVFCTLVHLLLLQTSQAARVIQPATWQKALKEFSPISKALDHGEPFAQAKVAMRKYREMFQGRQDVLFLERRLPREQGHVWERVVYARDVALPDPMNRSIAKAYTASSPFTRKAKIQIFPEPDQLASARGEWSGNKLPDFELGVAYLPAKPEAQVVLHGKRWWEGSHYFKNSGESRVRVEGNIPDQEIIGFNKAFDGELSQLKNPKLDLPSAKGYLFNGWVMVGKRDKINH